MRHAPLRDCLLTLVLGAAALRGADTAVETSARASGDRADPGPEHAALMAQAGSYTVSGSFWGAPGMAPCPATGVATFTPILGERYLRQDYHGAMLRASSSTASASRATTARTAATPWTGATA